MKKSKILLLVLAAVMCMGIFMTGCGSDEPEDPEVAAYDEWYIRTHDIFGNPR